MQFEVHVNIGNKPAQQCYSYIQLHIKMYQYLVRLSIIFFMLKMLKVTQLKISVVMFALRGPDLLRK
jgi:hypothetical protein